MKRCVNKSVKKFKYTLRSKCGKILTQQIISFGSEDNPFPENFENDAYTQMILQEYKQEFIENNFDIIISEDLNFDI